MDNFHIDTVNQGRVQLRLLLEYVIQMAPSRAFTAWAVFPAEAPEDVPKYEQRDPRPARMVFYWSMPEASQNAHSLPFAIDAAMATDLAIGWIEKTAEYPIDDMDCDGSTDKGWRVWNEKWGRVNGSHYGVFAISPEWVYYGK